MKLIKDIINDIIRPIFYTFFFVGLGQILGAVMTSPLRNFNDTSIDFLGLYLSFIGIWIIFIIYFKVTKSPLLNEMWKGMKGNTLKMFGIGILVGFGMNFLSFLIAYLHGDLELAFNTFDPIYFLAAIICVTVQSGAEELATRHYMYKTIRKRFGPAVALTVNALFFGVLHLANDGISWIALFQIVIIAVMLSLIVEYLDSFWMPVAIHTAWNYTQNFILGLPNSGMVAQKAILKLVSAKDSLFYSTAFGLEGAIQAGIIILIGCVIIYTKYGRKAMEVAGNEVE